MLTFGYAFTHFASKSFGGAKTGYHAFIRKPNFKKPNETLWFTSPAKYWNSQAMHIGNGFLGLSFLGGVEKEIFGVTEKTLWTGGPGEYAAYNYGIKKGGKNYLQQIRQLITGNKINGLKEADNLVRSHFLGDGNGYGHFSAFGRMNVKFNHTSKNHTNYSRSLDLSTAIAKVKYDINGATFKREYFCSYPDRVAVLDFSSTKKETLSFTINWDVFQKEHQVSFSNGVYQLSGNVNGNRQNFCLKMRIIYKDGRVYLQGKKLVLEKASNVTVIITAATEYTPEGPLYNGGKPEEITSGYLKKAAQFGFHQIKDRHIQDYKNLYNRIKLNIKGNPAQEVLTTNKRWENYAAKTAPDPGLKVLYFNLGRYLLISSSRPGSLPANLQGGWNMFESAQWSGNYQSNINVQLNYSSAASVNLPECQLPYINWIKNLVKPGEAVAREYYNSDGWVSHAIGNIWGYAAPGFELEWGMYPAAAAWHCHFVWKHFLYTQDLAYLKESGYDIMRGAAIFWLQNLVEYQGHLITAPSGSAEHGVYVQNGKMIATGSSFDAEIINVPGNFQDVEMVDELFGNTIKAAEVLDIDKEFVLKLKQSRSRLMPLKVGKYGQLQEWCEDLDSPECNHRHIGHLYALWPAKQITTQTKALAKAAKKTLNMRGEARNNKKEPHKDIYTAANWSLGLRMACWLRLHDAERANKIFTQIITTAGFENLMTYQQVPQTEDAVKSQPDVFFYKTGTDYWYPVWQIDTSLAIPGFVAEMLLQTGANGELILLPALPKEWPEGEITGLKAEGNITVDIFWKEMKVQKYRIRSTEKKKVKVIVNGVLKELETDIL